MFSHFLGFRNFTLFSIEDFFFFPLFEVLILLSQFMEQLLKKFVSQTNDFFSYRSIYCLSFEKALCLFRGGLCCICGRSQGGDCKDPDISLDPQGIIRSLCWLH